MLIPSQEEQDLSLAPPPAQAIGPYPSLGDCPVFPAPPASLSPRAPSLPNEAAWNQDVSNAPVAPHSAATIAYIDSHGGGFIHPDFGSPRAYGFPYAVVGAGRPKLPVHYTAYGDESDPGPFPIPKLPALPPCPGPSWPTSGARWTASPAICRSTSEA